MSPDHFTEADAIVFGERLNTFGENLSPNEQAFLKAILWDAEAAPDSASRVLDEVAARTFGQIALAIYRAYLTPAISLNPQPVPRDQSRFMDPRGDHG